MTVHGLFGGKEVTQCMPDNTVRERSVIWTASVLNDDDDDDDTALTLRLMALW